jgi:hypothetical protein
MRTNDRAGKKFLENLLIQIEVPGTQPSKQEAMTKFLPEREGITAMSAKKPPHSLSRPHGSHIHAQNMTSSIHHVHFLVSTFTIGGPLRYPHPNMTPTFFGQLEKRL